jgi:hypothetical protein
LKKIPLAKRIPLAACTALLMGGATAFFFIAMPTALNVALWALVAGSAAFVAGGLTWAAIGLAGKSDRRHSRRRRESVVGDGQPIHLRGEEYPAPPAWRPIFASEITSPDENDEKETSSAFELTDVVADEKPTTQPTLIEPLSIAALMARLEAGMERRAAETVEVIQAPVVPTLPAHDFGTLRNVLDELQRMAVR